MKVVDKLASIETEIGKACEKSGRSPKEVTIVAVTKYVSVERAKEAINAGITHFGENYDKGLLDKWGSLGDKPIWHFIGTLQTKKVKKIIEKVDYIHSLDRISLAEEINKRAREPVKCFVQVKTSDEESKHGISPSNVVSFVKDLEQLSNVYVVGLMTMAANTEDEAAIRESFRELKNLQNHIQDLKLDFAPCTELSMGMSNDFTIAIEEGATFIRIGTALVGE